MHPFFWGWWFTEFAEWGQPTGTCGNLARGADVNCSSDVRLEVEALCLDKSSCIIDTRLLAEYEPSCGDAHRLYVQVWPTH